MRVGAAAGSAFAARRAQPPGDEEDKDEERSSSQQMHVARRGAATVVEWIPDVAAENSGGGGGGGDDDDDNGSPSQDQPPRSYAGRVRVRFEDGSGEYHVRPEKCTPILRSSRGADLRPLERYLIVCEDTETYRKLARTQLTQEDTALEVGSSCGVGTNVMSECCRSAVGIEISFAEVEIAREKYPHIAFENFDCFEYKERLMELIGQSTCVFVDINGNRELESVVELTNLIIACQEVQLLVVKSKTLMRSFMLQFPSEVVLGSAALDRRPRQPKPKGCQVHADSIRKLGSGGFLFLDSWTAWWAGLVTHVKLSNLKNSRRVEAHSAPTRFLHYPLTYPMRYTQAGVGICRFHNYHRAGCLKGGACAYDHQVCHYCGELHHRALACPVVAADTSSGGTGRSGS